jgi:WD40 repeat protein
MSLIFEQSFCTTSPPPPSRYCHRKRIFFLLHHWDKSITAAEETNHELACSPCRQPLLALTNDEQKLQLWDVAKRKSVNVLHFSTDEVTATTFSSDSRLLASGSGDNTVRLWEMQTKECIATFTGHTKWICSVAFSPDGRLLASGSIDWTVRLWNVVERRAASPVDVLQGHTASVRGVSFAPDGRLLASGSFDKTVRLWSVPEGVPGLVLQHDECVFCVAFSPVIGSNILASGSLDGIRLWDVSSQQLLRQLSSDWVNDLSFSPSGSQLVAGLFDRTTRLWSVASGKLLKVLEGHSDAVDSVAFHPNGKQVASCSINNTVRVWTVCEWSDRTHHLFGEEIKRLVFCLMCAKAKLEKSGTKSRGFPRMSMALWLEIFAYFI